MQCNHKMKLKRKNSESGFVLIVALMGIMILLAVGFFALTVSTKDLMIASRLVGERKAFSAAEAGVHAIGIIYTVTTPDSPSWIPVDPANDPYTYYKFRNDEDVGGSETCSKAYSVETGGYSCKNYAGVVTGKYDPPGLFNDSETRIEIGIKGKATPNTPSYEGP